MSRKIKYFGGIHEAKSIKNQKQIEVLYGYLINKMRAAKCVCKKHQVEENYMLALIGINTAFRAEELLKLRVSLVERKSMIE